MRNDGDPRIDTLIKEAEHFDACIYGGDKYGSVAMNEKRRKVFVFSFSVSVQKGGMYYGKCLRKNRCPR